MSDILAKLIKKNNKIMQKEQYRRNLPHFHAGGQEFFITSNLKGAISKSSLTQYYDEMQNLSTELKNAKGRKAEEKLIKEIQKEYYVARNKHLSKIDNLLDQNTTSEINLNLPENRKILFEAFRYFEGKRHENYAFCVMRNHFHWVMRLYEQDENGEKLVLQDIMQIIHGVTANKINKLENKTGRTVWQGEAFETTIRNERHWYNAIMYTINNPVKAGLVKKWGEWEGTWCAFDM